MKSSSKHRKTTTLADWGEFRDRYEILAVKSVKPFKTPTEIIGTVIADYFCMAVFCGSVAEHHLIDYDE